MHHGEFRDERLVALYDVECPWSRDDDYFLSVLADEPATDVLDMGCGTGRLATEMAARGYRVTGIDPAHASLALARAKSPAVTWMLGSTESAPARAFDAVLMTSHVAQFLTDLPAALTDLRRSLRPGGRLIFDSRDPADRRWEQWTAPKTRHTRALPEGGTVELWTEITAVSGEAVSFTQHYEFSDGDHRTATATLYFREEQVLRAALTAAGFEVQTIHGGWNRDPVGHPDGEFLITAR